MQAIVVEEPGNPEDLKLGEHPVPQPGNRELLVQVAATAVNRADTLQRQGKYPVPQGASSLLGLEIAGTVNSTGEECSRFQPGDQVFGLIPGGGYAEYALIHEDMALAVPSNLSWEQAAAIPEVFLTAYQGLQWLGRLNANEWVVIHAGGSGVGTAAIQLAREMGAFPVITASSSKHITCQELGALYTIDYRQESFDERLKEITDGQGVDVILDFIGAPYWQQNIESLRTDGRLVILGLLGGAKTHEANLGKILRKRLQIVGSTLRSRSRDYQIRLTKDLADFALPRFEDGRLHPVIDSVFPLSQAGEAHAHMEANQNLGKIILKVSDSTFSPHHWR